MALWLPGLLVAAGAGAATAHGLFEVAVAAQVPGGLAWLYPVITDGLALVAYASTVQLTGKGRRYAWGVVVLAAGLSGLAQAVFLAGGVEAAPPALRFGVGAWPAVAAAIVAHLLFLLADARKDVQPPATPNASTGSDVHSERRAAVQPEPRADVRPSTAVPRAVQAVQRPAVQGSSVQPPVHSAAVQPGRVPVQPQARQLPSPARDRAEHEARKHLGRHGSLPTVTTLMELADVARGTAGTALKELREQPTTLHLINKPDSDDTTNDQAQAQS